MDQISLECKQRLMECKNVIGACGHGLTNIPEEFNAFHDEVMALVHKGRPNALIYLDLGKDLTLSCITPFSLNWRSIYMMDLLEMDMSMELEECLPSNICG